MSKNGGYKIIDFANKPFEVGVGMVYEGVYEAIESTRKPILFSGLNLDGMEAHDTFLPVEVNESAYVAKFQSVNGVTITITITDTDVVTITTDVEEV